MAVVELTKENFEKVVTSNPTVIIDFWAPWCGPCKGFAPVFERVAESHPDVVFAKVNTDDEQEIAQHFQIRSIPTLMVFRDQIIVFSQPGALPQNALEQVVAKAKELDMEEVRQQISQQDSTQGAQGGGEAATAAHPTH
jgi:thioredoxin 1